MLIILFACLYAICWAQDGVKLDTESDGELGGIASPLLSAKLMGTAGVNMSSQKWSTRIESSYPAKHYGRDVEEIKARKNPLKLPTQNIDPPTEPDRGIITPIIRQDFEANWMLNGTPPDDAMAVSNGGFIVTCNNDGIELYGTNGQFISAQFWADFFNNPQLNANIFDPRVEYDSGADRFVMAVLHGSSFTNSRVLMCFSKTNDPRDGWHYYQLTGDPAGNRNWFDYPVLGISTNEVYVTGNLFDSNDNFDQAVIYQIDKSTGYNGETIRWQYWSGLNNQPYSAFTLVPAVYGQAGNYGPGIYLVSNSPSQANQIRFWDLTNDIGSNPELRVYNIDIRPYEAPADALQKGSQDRLQTGGSRIQDAFYLNEKLHFVFHKDIGDAWSGIAYYRLNVRDRTIREGSFGLSGSYDYSYPSLASFSSSPTDEAAMICFLRSSSDIYPEVRVVSVDDDFEWSNSVLVKEGETFVDIVQGDERWGDYTSMTRQHNGGEPTVWLSGSYGADILQQNAFNTYKTRIARIGGEATSVHDSRIPPLTTRAYPNPTQDEFSLEFDVVHTGFYAINVYDHEGRTIRHLFEDRLKQGSHTLKFNKGALRPGTYHVVIQKDKQILANETLIIYR